MEMKPVEDISMSDVVEYLNCVLENYGPPCDWCVNFGNYCKRKYKPRCYSLEYGPYEYWTMRKFCKDFDENSNINIGDFNKDIERKVKNSLDCLNQTYCK